MLARGMSAYRAKTNLCASQFFCTVSRTKMSNREKCACSAEIMDATCTFVAHYAEQWNSTKEKLHTVQKVSR